MEYSENEKRSLMIVGGIIVFSIAAIVAFIYTGGGILFYIIAALALVLEFYMAYKISKEAEEEKRPARSGKKTGK